MAKKKFGTIIVPPGAFIDRHEKLTVDLLAIKLKRDITFLVASRKEHDRTADVEMDGLLWEIKSPYGKSSRTIENNLRLALLQSPYIVLDLRRLDGRVPTEKRVREAEKQFHLAKSIKRLIVVTKEEDIIDFRR